MTKFKAGDKVRLIGEDVLKCFPTTGYATMVSDHEYRLEGREDIVLFACKYWEVELIEESTVGVKFEDVQVGDRVRLTAANGDVAEFTAILASGDWLDSATNSYSKSHWEKVEILTRAQKPLVPGLYENGNCNQFFILLPDGRAFFTCNEGSWIAVKEENVRRCLEEEEESNQWTRQFDL